MKRVILLCCAILCTLQAICQTKSYLWPISGADAGQGIISGPQSYIDKELNSDGLFITAPEGTVVLSPTDGVVYNYSIGYLSSLRYSSNFHIDKLKSFNDNIKIVVDAMKIESEENPDKTLYHVEYISGSLAIRTPKGEVIWFSGLKGDYHFKTGQTIKRGEPIGEVAYSYRKFSEPTIKLSISKSTLPSDPLTPFGLKTTFIPASQIKPIKSLTKQEAKEDINILIDVTKELFPSLRHLMSPEEVESFRAELIARIDSVEGDKVKMEYFSTNIIAPYKTKIHDSHIHVHPLPWVKHNHYKSQPNAYIGWINDTLTAYITSERYKEFIGKEIVEINGMSIDSMRRIITDHHTAYDAAVESYTESKLAVLGFGPLFRDGNFDMEVKFADGQQTIIKERKGPLPEAQVLNAFLNYNRLRGSYLVKMLNDSTAYMGVSTFQLNQVQVDNVVKFVDSISKAEVPYLIVDVRNNNGGDVEVVDKLVSLFLNDTLKLSGYQRVNKNSGYKSFKYSTNYQHNDTTLFSDFKPREGHTGFYLSNDNSQGGGVIAPDSVVNYKGKLYVMANENSISAATFFPAVIVRTHRGVVVGRETRTAYHYMTALKSVDIRLPNSTRTISLPPVEMVFDTVVNDRVPFGRGVLPDYPLPLSLDEILSTNGDHMLNHTLELIGQGKYLSEVNPFATITLAEESAMFNYVLIAVVFTVFLVLVVLVILFRRRRRRR